MRAEAATYLVMLEHAIITPFFGLMGRRVQRLTAAVWQTEKLDLAELERAAEKN